MKPRRHPAHVAQGHEVGDSVGKHGGQHVPHHVLAVGAQALAGGDGQRGGRAGGRASDSRRRRVGGRVGKHPAGCAVPAQAQPLQQPLAGWRAHPKKSTWTGAPLPHSTAPRACCACCACCGCAPAATAVPSALPVTSSCTRGRGPVSAAGSIDSAHAGATKTAHTSGKACWQTEAPRRCGAHPQAQSRRVPSVLPEAAVARACWRTSFLMRGATRKGRAGHRREHRRRRRVEVG